MFINAPTPSAEMPEFRAEIRDFCRQEMTPVFRRKLELGQHITKDEHDAWLKALGRRGWLAGNWPKEHGGLGWSPEQTSVFREEMQRVNAPWLIPFGVLMVGPVIYTFGSDAQKKKFLPDIISNSLWWCQGYSEPGAGSDLAGLKTRAERDGDHYIVNGQKTWTTLAHWADWIFCLVRTDPDARKQAGISFLLIDMKTPGISVRPIRTIDKHHHLNEVFFDNVRVPLENLVGEENKGWNYAKFLLANERAAFGEIARFTLALAQLRELLGQVFQSGKPLLQDDSYRKRLAEHEIELTGLRAIVDDVNATVRAGGNPPLIGAAALKIRASELQQAISQTAADAMSHAGLTFDPGALMPGWTAEPDAPELANGLMYEHLYGRAATIFGGASEIQRNIIAKGALGL